MPERPSRVEGLAGLLPGEIEELAHRAGGRQPDSRDVVVEVQVGDLDPVEERRSAGFDPLAQPGERLDRGRDARSRAISGGRRADATATIVDRSAGSRSIIHSTASELVSGCIRPTGAAG